MVVLSKEQLNAVAAINSFLETENKQTFTMHGLAGSGKSTILGEIVKTVPDVLLCAPTGKAASVLSAKSNYPARTIHSLFYRLIENDIDPNTGKKNLKFARIHQPGTLKGKVILLDESSMVDTKIGNDLKQTGAKIIASGDPGQLQPVNGKQLFNKADFTLTEIHRQALESPIIRQAHSVRQNGRYKTDGDNFQVREFTMDDLKTADMVLCWKNKTRQEMNKIMREIRGYTNPYPSKGESLMCLKNARDHGVYNGNVYPLTRDFRPNDTKIYLDIEDKEIGIPKCRFVGPHGSLDDARDDDISCWDYGYCLTTHKAMGSEYKYVLLIDEYTHPEQRKEWVYTSLTRASERITISR
jgi:exodeoxyribonuclease V